MASAAPFTLVGPALPASPVLLTVPHAGRYYPPSVVEAARVPVTRLQALEDRYADALIGPAVAQGATAIVASVARATIDLNRDPREIDPAMIDGVLAPEDLLLSGKVRAGLGLFPRRLPSCGDLWRRRLTLDMVQNRIAELHAPYHAAIAQRLELTRQRFGAAVLIDCHSMPPLPVRQPDGPVRIVVGDRFGAGASIAAVDLIMAVIESVGLIAARNHPYAGGYTIDRHGRPRHNVHAIQIEYDRSLYLDAALDRPGPNVEGCGRLLATIASRLESLFRPEMPIAAE
ncbi:N-formylglutamate amidohydrolase [Rhizorhabdus sp.]|uniref:N-formylglutamate amidohydrolase n=1 Tax=Rhizorhabdus sp. TaxID=1968843 RepID=UPI001B4210C5|nr:N-formylglutamate amidohydrolase [Rhizorhabdus sp.]MBP8234832.1 N-formylglutamate amidohydrolase [Rhizorhabdus sp.]